MEGDIYVSVCVCAYVERRITWEYGIFLFAKNIFFIVFMVLFNWTIVKALKDESRVACLC